MKTRSPFKPITSTRTFEGAVDQIVAAIRLGDLKIGDRLPAERELASIMQVSRPTLREALKVLADAELLTTRRGAGGGVFIASDNITTELLTRGAEVRVSQVTGVLQARRLLEPRVAQLAAITGGEEDFEAMQDTIDAQRADPSDRIRFVELDHRFHLVMASATRNTTVIEMMTAVIKKLEIAYDMIYRDPHEPDRGIALHEETLAALLSRDHDQIEIAMDHHLAFLEETWKRESGRAPLRDVQTFLSSGRPLGEGDRSREGADGAEPSRAPTDSTPSTRSD